MSITTNDQWQTLTDETHSIDVSVLRIRDTTTTIVSWNYKRGERRRQASKESLSAAIDHAYQRHRAYQRNQERVT